MHLLGPAARDLHAESRGEGVAGDCDGDVVVDLGRPGLGEGWKRIIGVVLIMVINLVGIAVMVRIWKKGD